MLLDDPSLAGAKRPALPRPLATRDTVIADRPAILPLSVVTAIHVR